MHAHRLSWHDGVREHRIRAVGGALLAIGLLYLAFLGGAEGRPAAALFLVALVAVVVGGVLVWWGRRPDRSRHLVREESPGRLARGE